MIVNNGEYYLYRHIRDDKNMPFYIGVGKKEDNGRKRITTEYRRAYVHFNRNKYWKNVVSNTSYSVEILLESDDREFITNKEKEFISLYGRKDNGSGFLCNMTDGGDYYNTHEKYEKQGINKLSKLERSRITKNCKRHELGSNPVQIFIYDKISGNYISSYPQIKKASIELGISKNKISESLSNRSSYKNYLFLRLYMGDKVNINSFKIKAEAKKPVIKIDPTTKQYICRYESAVDAAKENGVFNSNIQNAIKNTLLCGGFYWKYDNNEPFVLENKRRRHQKVAKICKDKGSIIECYSSIKEAAILNKIKSTSSIQASITKKIVRSGFVWAKID